MTDILSENGAWLDGASADDLRRVTDALYRVHKLSELVTEYSAVLDMIMVESRTVANAEACSLLLYDEVEEELFFSVALNESDEQSRLLKQIRLKLDQGIAGECATRRVSINVPDAAHDPRIHTPADEASGFETRTLLVVPLVDQEHLIGVLEVVNKVDGEAFTEFDARIMEMFASLAASVITQSRLIDENLESERLAAIGETVAGLSHYTKNILTVVSVSSEIIDDGLVQKKIGILENPWKIMKRSLKRLSYVIEDMLAYSTERQPVYELYPLAELIDDVVTSVEGMQGRKSIQIELDVSGLSEPVMIDSRGMHRCLLNLVLNAVDELPDADGCVKVAGTRLDSGIVRITVEDNGAGIKEENLDRIFNPFFSTKGNRGTGLGLAVTQKIVAEHGGRISAGNRETGGAVFTIEFPERPRESDGVMG